MQVSHHGHHHEPGQGKPKWSAAIVGITVIPVIFLL